MSDAVARIRLRIDGPNRIAEQAGRTAMGLFAAQFKSTLVAVLALAAVLSAVVGELKDAAVIVVVLILNALVGFWQEYRAERSLWVLKQMLPARTRVLRDGASGVVPAEVLVRGDIVLLEAGDRVPADGRLLSTHGVAIDESTLTGESQPAEKDARAILPMKTDLADRVNMAYMNTMMVRGRGELLVTATGVRTEMGRISLAIAAAPEAPSPLQVQLDRFGKRLGVIALTLIGVVFVFELARGTALAHIILDSIALAVAAVPEGLPVVVTVTLALGMQQMARQRAIVKRLASVETLGSTTVICSDKTGTLTLNQMTAKRFLYAGRRYRVTGEGYGGDGNVQCESADGAADFAALMLPLVLCNDTQIRNGALAGDPMEGALLALAMKTGMTRESVSARYPRVAEVPFDSGHKYMATFHRTDAAAVVFVKGAPDVLLPSCTRIATADGEAPLDDAGRAAVQAEYSSLAGEGLRGLLIASRRLTSVPENGLHSAIRELTLVGLVGLMDPPRPEARAAIADCETAGIAVKMITGDHPETATTVARSLGLRGEALTGARLENMDVEAIAALMDRTAVFARVTPHHKVKIVQALKTRGHIVAMTGDGVNDAPALKHADIGIAMGIAGTAVSKEAASMVLTDDNFTTIVGAVREGRILYDNIVKFVRFQLSTTIGAIFTVFFAPFFDLPEPFTPIQILWVALIMDGPPAVSLALDAARPGLMQEPPRPKDQPILPWYRITKIVGFGATMAVGTIGVLAWAHANGYVQSHSATLAFTTFVLFQFFNVFNSRVEQGSAFNDQIFRNRLLWVSLITVLLLQVIAVHWAPAQSVFRTTALSWSDWVLACVVASTVLALEEARKLAVALLRSIGKHRHQAGRSG